MRTIQLGATSQTTPSAVCERLESQAPTIQRQFLLSVGQRRIVALLEQVKRTLRTSCRPQIVRRLQNFNQVKSALPTEVAELSYCLQGREHQELEDLAKPQPQLTKEV